MEFHWILMMQLILGHPGQNPSHYIEMASKAECFEEATRMADKFDIKKLSDEVAGMGVGCYVQKGPLPKIVQPLDRKVEAPTGAPPE